MLELASCQSGFLDIELMDGLLALPCAELRRHTITKGSSLAVERTRKEPVTLLEKQLVIAESQKATRSSDGTLTVCELSLSHCPGTCPDTL